MFLYVDSSCPAMVAVFLRLVEAQLFLLPANPLSTASKSSSGIA
ncbi:MAG: hypothetical protein ACI8P0_006525, partial [Planctomycetaceae bacterium]